MSLPPIQIAPGLERKLDVYRITDFYSAAAMLESNSLMLTRADLFDDPNEGIDRLLSQLQHSHPDGCGGTGWNDLQSATRAHHFVQRSHYVSCWSRESESVAMWSIYSPDRCSIRIKTTVEVLEDAAASAAKHFCISKIASAPVHRKFVSTVEARIAPAMYAPLSYLVHRISRRAGARKRLVERYKRNGQKIPVFDEVDPRYWQREQQRRFLEVSKTCLLKDSSFAHEQEIRVLLRLGEERLSPKLLERILEILPTDSKYHDQLESFLQFWGPVSETLIPERIFAICSKQIIHQIAVDPRCPPHKKQFIERWFQEHGIPVVQSSCFGYAASKLTSFPEW
jgi:hypothetical protein